MEYVGSSIEFAFSELGGKKKKKKKSVVNSAGHFDSLCCHLGSFSETTNGQELQQQSTVNDWFLCATEHEVAGSITCRGDRIPM